MTNSNFLAVPSANQSQSSSQKTAESVSARLFVRIVEARNLLPPAQGPLAARPYCVVEFDSNECVTREPLAINGAQTHAGSSIEALANAAVAAAPETVASAFLAQATAITATLKAHRAAHASQTSDGIFPVWCHEATFDVSRPDGELAISIWDRLAASGEETFLGMMRIRPPRENGKLYDNWFKLLPRFPNEQIRGDIRIQFKFTSVNPKPLSADDFELLKVVGKGSFGKVLQVRKKDTGRIYAMKVLNKKNIVERQEIQHTLSERNVLVQATSPFLVGLKYSFQTPEKLYLVLDYKSGGELFYHLQKETVFPEIRAKFYICELILALEHLHRYKVVYRDLKPENVLLDSSGHIALADFGLCKENIDQNDTTNTFCGTAEYLAPEVLQSNGYGIAVDWWSLGILFYEMTTGLPPFYSENTNLMYKKILLNQLVFPPNYPPLAQSFVTEILHRDPKQRLGGRGNDAQEVKSHPYFADVDWERLSKRRIRPPFKPKVESEIDTSNFDPAFTQDMPIESMIDDTPLSQTIQENFKGFTYTNENAHMNGSMMSSSSFMSNTMGSYQSLRHNMK